MSDIVFIYPGIVGCGFSSFGKTVDSSWMSHGLASLSACLLREGLSRELIDLRRLSGWEEFRKVMEEKKARVVGVTMMSVDFNPAIKSMEIIKRINPKIRVIVGGAHPTLATQEVERIKAIDYIVLGEGEIVLPKLIKDIQRGKKGERVVRGIRPDLNRLPFADRELFGAKEIPIVPELPLPFVSIITGRGCLYNCNFCKPGEDLLFGKPVRRRNARNVIEELKILRRQYNFRSLMIHDDCLTEDRNWVEEFCRSYRKEGFKQPFICQSRADIICRNPDMVRLMAKTGLYMYLIGFESGNQRVLNFIRKGTRVEQNFKATEICRRNGIRVWANYMVGLPTETKKEVWDTVKMIQKIKPDYFSPAFFTPHPGSDLFDYCLKNRLSLIKSHDQYRRDPKGAKIKGQDYQFLSAAVRESVGISLPEKIARAIKRKWQKFWWQINLR